MFVVETEGEHIKIILKNSFIILRQLWQKMDCLLVGA